MIFREPRESEFPKLRELWKEAFGDDDSFIDAFKSTSFSPARARIAVIGEQVASALYFFDCECDGCPIAYLYAIATAKKYRGMGICRELMKNTHLHLQECGYTGALLVPAEDTLFDFYKKIGYSHVGYLKKISVDAADKAISLNEIDKRDYANIRRKLLPSISVIQEGSCLDFLETQAKFYKGDNFLLCARKDGDFLYGIELLGDCSVASSILTVLGCKKGSFKIPGNENRFFLYLPFSRTSPIPSYFSFAFE